LVVIETLELAPALVISFEDRAPEYLEAEAIVVGLAAPEALDLRTATCAKLVK